MQPSGQSEVPVQDHDKYMKMGKDILLAHLSCAIGLLFVRDPRCA
jgi:hypothetical protein